MSIIQPAKTFEELQTDASVKWQEVLDQRTAQFKTMFDAMAGMPDVLHKPEATQHWTPDPVNIICPCGGNTFLVSRWVTINGVRHRFEGTCTACLQVRTYDWQDGVFI